MEGTIRQRSAGSWEIQVFLGRDVNGKRMRKTETVRGKRRTPNVDCAKYCPHWTVALPRPKPSTNWANGWTNGWRRKSYLGANRKPSTVTETTSGFISSRHWDMSN